MDVRPPLDAGPSGPASGQTYALIFREELHETMRSHFRLGVGLVVLGILFFALLNLCRIVSRISASPGTDDDKEGPGGGSNNAGAATAANGERKQKWRRIRAVAALSRKYLGYVPVPFIGLCASELLIVALYVGTLLTLLLTATPTPPTDVSDHRRVIAWSDLAGKMAVASVPFNVLLSSKRSLLNLLVGVDFLALQFLHRWAGRFTLCLAVAHGSAKLVSVRSLDKEYLEMGLAAFSVAVAILLTAHRLLQRYAYEVFFASHFVLVAAFIALAWLHQPRMKYWLIFSLLIWGSERLFRLVRLFLVNGLWRRRSSRTERRSRITILSSSVLRVEMPAPDFPAWSAGSYAILSAPGSTWWPQGHPFTIASAPTSSHLTLVFLIRARSGWTRKLLKLAEKGEPIPLLVEGPYGDMPSLAGRFDTIVLVAGGTGITWALSVLLSLGVQAQMGVQPARAVHLIWVAHGTDALHWIDHEVRQALRSLPPSLLHITIFLSSGFSDLDVPRPFLDHHNIQLHRGRPSIPDVLGSIQRCAQGRTYVGCSGPSGLSEGVRRTVRSLIDPMAIWRGSAKGDIELHLELFGW